MAPAETPTGCLRIAHRDLRTAMAMADSSVFEEDSWVSPFRWSLQHRMVTSFWPPDGTPMSSQHCIEPL